MKIKNKKVETLGASLLGNMLTGKGVLRAKRGHENMDENV